MFDQQKYQVGICLNNGGNREGVVLVGFSDVQYFDFEDAEELAALILDRARRIKEGMAGPNAEGKALP